MNSVRLVMTQVQPETVTPRADSASGMIGDDPSTELSSHRTAMSFDRTALSNDRTLMSVVRTSLSLIAFGFTIFQFFHKVSSTYVAGDSPRVLPFALVSHSSSWASSCCRLEL